ncbi:MAG: hypothetical protein ACP5GZ_06945 [Vulcanisaeta sp.]|jgi:preprotein translocase subunit Sss1|uniref:hypothetical protein n=1 Tax=Vulcanisaeta TaxID=164450 RepID=UPI00064F36B2|nr:hypothetical protein [Vulcanisaeta moutnovskia]
MSHESWSKKIVNWLSTIAWIFKVAKKPTRSNYMIILKLGSLIVAILGVYSFLFSVAQQYLTSSANFSLPYPLNLIIILTIIIILAVMLILVLLSTRGLGRK